MKDNKLNHDLSEPKSFLIIKYLVVFMVFIIVVFVGSVFYFYGTQTVELNFKEADYVSKQMTEIQLLKDQENKDLNTLKWKNKSKGRVQIPINDAIDVIVKRYN